MKQFSILISGANGTVGRDLVDKLSINNKIFGIYRTKNKAVRKIKNVVWIKHDLKKDFKLKLKPDPKLIINCVATHEFSKKKKYKDYFNSNVQSLKKLASFAKKTKAKLLINLSTITIYGDIKKNILKENYKPKNQSILGRTKFLSEKVLNGNQVNFINIRLPGVLCKSSQNDGSRPWINSIFHKMNNNKDIIVYNSKSKFNNVIDTTEIVHFIKFLIKKNFIIKDTFNFSGSNPINLMDIIKYARIKLNSKSKIININKKNKKSFTISVDKLNKKLNYQTRPVKKIIDSYLKLLKNNA